MYLQKAILSRAKKKNPAKAGSVLLFFESGTLLLGSRLLIRDGRKRKYKHRSKKDQPRVKPYFFTHLCILPCVERAALVVAALYDI